MGLRILHSQLELSHHHYIICVTISGKMEFKRFGILSVLFYGIDCQQGTSDKSLVEGLDGSGALIGTCSPARVDDWNIKKIRISV